VREKYCWLVAGGCFVLREKHYWLVADKPFLLDLDFHQNPRSEWMFWFL
jgi:hypothetical protein